MIEGHGHSFHVRCASSVSVAEVLLRIGPARGTAVPVWPPRRLPNGILLSGVRNGWVSIWSCYEEEEDWSFPLTASLECGGVGFYFDEERWLAEFIRDGRRKGCVDVPSDFVAWENLSLRVARELIAEGRAEEACENEDAWRARMESIPRAEYEAEAQREREDRPDPEALLPFLPPGATVERAWELLTAIERPDDESHERGMDPSDYLEAFAAYLGIPEAAWEPMDDWDALADGDYDDEGAPEGWREFVMLPVPQLRVLWTPGEAPPDE